MGKSPMSETLSLHGLDIDPAEETPDSEKVGGGVHPADIVPCPLYARRPKVGVDLAGLPRLGRPDHASLFSISVDEEARRPDLADVRLLGGGKDRKGVPGDLLLRGDPGGELLCFPSRLLSSPEGKQLGFGHVPQLPHLVLEPRQPLCCRFGIHGRDGGGASRMKARMMSGWSSRRARSSASWTTIPPGQAM